MSDHGSSSGDSNPSACSSSQYLTVFNEDEINLGDDELTDGKESSGRSSSSDPEDCVLTTSCT